MHNAKTRNHQEGSRLRAIVIGLGHPSFLGAIRSLGRAGIPVVGVNYQGSPRMEGVYSRYLSEKFQISKDHDEALGFLESLGQDGGGVLMPPRDDYLILVAKNYDRLSRYFALTMPPWEILRRVMDTSECYGIAGEAGLNTPHFFRPRDEKEMRKIVSSLDFAHHDYILKTMPGTVPADVQTGRFSKVAGPDPASIEENCREIFSRLGEFPVIVEVVPGEADRCIGVSMVVDRNHESVMCYCVRRLKLHTYSTNGRFIHPYEMGANIYCESIHDDEAVEAAKKFVRQAKYYGAITVEFRRHPTDESLILIKADPRFVRSTSLSTALGLDVPIALYRVFTNGLVETPRTYPDGVAWVWLTWCLFTLWKNRSSRPVRKELFALLRNVHRIKAFAYLNVRDPLPFVVDVLWWRRSVKWEAIKMARALKRRTGLTGRRLTAQAPGSRQG